MSVALPIRRPLPRAVNTTTNISHPRPQLRTLPSPWHARSLTPSLSRTLTTTRPLLAHGYPKQGHPRDPISAHIPIPQPNPHTLPSRHMPAYPYGPRLTYKRANRGLYGSATIQFGDQISSKWNRKSRRTWRPNVQRKRLWSASLRCFVQTMVTTRVMRTVDKVGGLDEYLLGGRKARLLELGVWGWKLRWRIMQTEAVKERFRTEREVLARQVGADGKSVMAEEVVDEVSREMERLGGLGGGAGKQTEEEVLAETQKMLDEDQVFHLREETASEGGFMREEPRPKSL